MDSALRQFRQTIQRGCSLQAVLIIFLFTFALNSFASPNTHAFPIIVDASSLKQTLKSPSPNLRIIDLRTKEAYLEGHIPGAINIPFGEFNRSINSVKGFLITPIKFQKLLESKGLTEKDYIILYSDKTILDSTRVFWSFDFYGHEKLSILNGGIQAWLKSEGRTSTQMESLPPSHYQTSIHPDKFSSKFKTFMATKLDNTVILDARPPEQYAGIESHTSRYGHIPSAQNLPWKTLVEEVEGIEKGESYLQYRDLDQLKETFKGVPEDKDVIVYCNGGRESSVLYFGLRLLNKQGAAYDGSWFEWSADSSLPISLPAAPNDGGKN